MKKYPLIISAPHAVSEVSDEIKNRLLLTDYQIWKFSDPVTGKTAKHPKAFLHNIATTHRLMGDLSFGPKPLFPLRETDFYGNKIFKKDQKFTESEHKKFLENTAKPFSDNILKGITELEKLGFSKILLVDHHNTAGDHTVGKTGAYMPVIAICNGGAEDSGKPLDQEESIGISCPPEFLHTFNKAFTQKSGFSGSINKVYKMSHTIRWILNEVRSQFPHLEINALFLEWNLNFVHNSFSKTNDLQALEIMHQSINEGVSAILQKYFL